MSAAAVDFRQFACPKCEARVAINVDTPEGPRIRCAGCSTHYAAGEHLTPVASAARPRARRDTALMYIPTLESPAAPEAAPPELPEEPAEAEVEAVVLAPMGLDFGTDPAVEAAHAEPETFDDDDLGYLDLGAWDAFEDE